MDQIKIGKFIAQLRREADLTQEALGQKLGVTNKTVSRWENGNYMPDIELLKILSELFQISINELLCGERLSDGDFRDKADENLISTVKESCFSVKERSAFWKKKWLKDHLALILISIIAAVAVYIGLWLTPVRWLTGFCPLLWLLLYVILRNRMMIYIEDKVYSINQNIYIVKPLEKQGESKR